MYVDKAARLYGMALFNAYDAGISGRLDSDQLKQEFVASEFSASDTSDIHKTTIVYYFDSAVLLPFLAWPGRFANKSAPYTEYVNRSYLSDVMTTDSCHMVGEAVLSGEVMAPSNTHNGAQVGILPDHFAALNNAVANFYSDWEGRVNAYRVRKRIPHGMSLVDHFVSICDQSIHALQSHVKKCDEGYEISRGKMFAEILADVESHPVMEFANVRRVQGLMVSKLPYRARFPSPERISPWIRRISSHRTRSGYGRLGVSANESEARRLIAQAERDARCIAQIEILNEMALERNARSEGGRVVHCLVTGESSIHSAYLAAKDADVSEGKYPFDISRGIDSEYLNRFYIRHPAQFTPVLNQFRLLDYSSARESLLSSVIRATRARIAKTVRTNDAGWAVGFKTLFGNSDRRDYIVESDNSPHSRKLIDSWIDLTYLSVLLNRDVMTRRISRGRSAVEELGSSDASSFQRIIALQRKTLLETQKNDLAVAAAAAINDVTSELREVSSDTPRMKTFLISKFSWGESGLCWNHVMDRIRAGDDQFVEKMCAEVIDDKPCTVWKAFLLCGLISGEINSWQKSRWYYERAWDRLRMEADSGCNIESDEWCDIYYLLGRARRLNPSWLEFALSKMSLNSSLDHAKDVARGCNYCVCGNNAVVRSSSEIAALYLAQLVFWIYDAMLASYMELEGAKREVARPTVSTVPDSRRCARTYSVKRALVASCTKVDIEELVRKMIENFKDVARNAPSDQNDISQFVRRQFSLNYAVLIIVSRLDEEILNEVDKCIGQDQHLEIFRRALEEWRDCGDTPPIVQMYLAAAELFAHGVEDRWLAYYCMNKMQKFKEVVDKKCPLDSKYAAVILAAVEYSAERRQQAGGR